MLKKVIIGFVALVVLFFGALIASTFIFKDKINALIKAQINKELKVSVDYTDYDLSIIRSFPDFQFSLSNLTVIGQDKFAGDTLARIKDLNFNLDAKKLYFDRALLVHSVYIDELNLKAYILADSTSSLDILKNPSTAEDTSATSMVDTKIASFIVKNSNILYSDALAQQDILLKNINIDAEIDYVKEKALINTVSSLSEIYYSAKADSMLLAIEGFEVKGKATYLTENIQFDGTIKSTRLSYDDAKASQKIAAENITIDALASYVGQVFDVKTKTDFAQLDVILDNAKMINKAHLSIDGTVNADLAKSKYIIDQKIGLNDVQLDLKGNVANPNEDILMDLVFKTNKSTFKSFLSLIPEQYLKDYKDLKVEGGFALNGNVKGIYNETNYPNFDIKMNIENGYFKYPSLPTAVEKINLSASVSNSSADLSNMQIVVPNATFTVENEPIALSLTMLNVVNDPYVDLKAKGKLDLKKVPDFYKIEGLKTLSGNLDADIQFKGKLADVENEKYDKVDFQGDMKVSNLVYESKETAMPLKVKTLNLDFSPRYANLSSLDMNYGKSDIKATGKLENVINYVLSDGILKGNLAVQSNKIDLTEMMGEESTTTETTSTSEVVKVPKNIDFTATASVNELKYDDINLTQMKGALSMQNEVLAIKSVSANMLGGNAIINGTYSTAKPGDPLIDFKYDIKNFDIKQSFNYVNTIEKIAPIAQYLDGKFSSSFAFNSTLDNTFMPDLTKLTGLGDVRISYAKFMNFPMFKAISDVVKVPLVNDLNKAAINNAWTVFKINNGKVNVEPFDYVYQDMKLNLYGSNGFDKTMDYTIKLTVPSNKFGNAANVANDWLSKQKIPLLNLSVPKDITFHLNVSGLINKPVVKIIKVTTDGSDKGVIQQITTNVADQAKAEADKLKKEAEARAKAEAEKLKKELEAKAKAEADKLKKEAEERAKKEAEKILNDALKDKLPKFGF